jgi:dienelactone hydrolase
MRLGARSTRLPPARHAAARAMPAPRAAVASAPPPPLDAAALAAARAELLAAISRGRVAGPPAVETAPASWPPPPADVFCGLAVEDLRYFSDAHPTQGWVPLRLARLPPPASASAAPHQLPVVLLLHPTGGDVDGVAQWQARLARRGFLAAAIDARYHGRRAVSAAAYQEALAAAWRGDTAERPFLLDTVWDAQRLLDLLAARPDVDASRIGAAGFSLGGMHAWLLAAADTRVAAAVPIAGVQHFGWNIENDAAQARAESLPAVFAAAAAALGLPPRAGGRYAPAVAAAVWARLLPAMLERWDAPTLLALVAPRPLLVATGELDERCPLGGVRVAAAAAVAAYAAAGAPEGAFSLRVDAGVGHDASAGAWAAVDDFLAERLAAAPPP